ncbi:quinate permease [Fusarium agapanthi]|uniref:Quinate permease n=1 Tax=Fusarium agapanthi TaxID=1803897 RepID=A0A9P5B9E6_9HYPO|nr:quinate permease [Fusarium agapanthi]
MESTVDERTKLAYQNRWRTLAKNPKLIVIALFASFGGFEYGYQQGVLGQSLVMHRFKENFPSIVNSSSATGWLTSILQLGGILGSLSAGVFGEVYSRRYTMFLACCWVILGSYLYIGGTKDNASMLYAGRFFTGIGVGTSSGVGSSSLRRRIILLALGIWWLPFSPRWLVKQGRDEEALKTLSYLRNVPIEHELIQVEYKEIKAEALFEQCAFAKNFPNLAAKEQGSIWMAQFAQYYQIFRTKDNFKRVATAWLVMFWRQWLLHWRQELRVLCSSSLAIIDKVGRKPMLYVGSIVMLTSMVRAGIIVAKFQHDWETHSAAGWVAVAFIWLYVGAFGATWGPGSSIGASSNWLNNFAVAFYVPPMFETLEWGTYIFFAVFLACIFGSHTGEEDAKMLDEARRDDGLGIELEVDALKAEKALVEDGEIETRPSHHENA